MMAKVIWKIKRNGAKLKKSNWKARKEYKCRWCKKKFKCYISGEWNSDIGPICTRCYVKEKYRPKKKKIKFAMK